MYRFKPAMGATHIDNIKLAPIIKTFDNNQARPSRISENPALVRELQKIDIFINCAELTDWSIYPYVYEDKIDGYSYLGINADMFSRSVSEAVGNEGNPICKSGHVPHIIEELRKIQGIFGFVDFHGELHVEGGTSDDVTKIMGCDVEKALARQAETGWLGYEIYDIRAYKGIDVTNKPWYVRKALMDFIKLMFPNLQYITFADTFYTHPREAFAEIVGKGGEGIMIKNTKSVYSPDKKPAGVWIKCKKEITVDVVIMGYNAGTGKNAGSVGSIIVGMYINGKLTEVANVSGITDELRSQLNANRDGFIGRVIEIKAMHPNANKITFRSPRFLRFRDDKNANQCVADTIHPSLELI